MKSAPQLSDETPWARLDRAFRTVIKIPKEELLKEEAKEKRAKLRAKIAKTWRPHE
jgi:hypothetical protein